MVSEAQLAAHDRAPSWSECDRVGTGGPPQPTGTGASVSPERDRARREPRPVAPGWLSTWWWRYCARSGRIPTRPGPSTGRDGASGRGAIELTRVQVGTG